MDPSMVDKALTTDVYQHAQ